VSNILNYKFFMTLYMKNVVYKIIFFVIGNDRVVLNDKFICLSSFQYTIV